MKIEVKIFQHAENTDHTGVHSERGACERALEDSNLVLLLWLQLKCLSNFHTITVDPRLKVSFYRLDSLIFCEDRLPSKERFTFLHSNATFFMNINTVRNTHANK